MSDFSALIYLALDEADRPTSLAALGEGDSIASSVLPPSVRNTVVYVIVL